MATNRINRTTGKPTSGLKSVTASEVLRQGRGPVSNATLAKSGQKLTGTAQKSSASGKMMKTQQKKVATGAVTGGAGSMRKSATKRAATTGSVQKLPYSGGTAKPTTLPYTGGKATVTKLKKTY